MVSWKDRSVTGLGPTSAMITLTSLVLSFQLWKMKERKEGEGEGGRKRGKEGKRKKGTGRCFLNPQGPREQAWCFCCHPCDVLSSAQVFCTINRFANHKMDKMGARPRLALGILPHPAVDTSPPTITPASNQSNPLFLILLGATLFVPNETSERQ